MNCDQQVTPITNDGSAGAIFAPGRSPVSDAMEPAVAALPGTGVAAFGLVGGQAHGECAGALQFFDLDGAIAETDQMVGVDAGTAEDALDQHAALPGTGVAA